MWFWIPGLFIVLRSALWRAGGEFFGDGRRDPKALAQLALLVDHLLRELAHEAAADALIDHGARAVRVGDMLVDAVAVAMPVPVIMMVVMTMAVTVIVVVMPVIMVMAMIVIMIVIAGTALVIHWIAVFGVVVMHLDLTAGKTLLEGRHQVGGLNERAFGGFRDPFHKGVDHMRLIGKVVRLVEGDARLGFRDLVNIVLDPVDQAA